MGRIVYADLLFLINFSMDLLCLYITARLLHRDFKLWRNLVGASVGGIYSVAILFIESGPAVSILTDLGVCAVMCLFSFGHKKSAYGFLLCVSVFFGVSAGLGGFMTAIYSFLNRLSLPLSELQGAGDGVSVWLFGLLAIVSGFAAMVGGRLFRGSSLTRTADIEISYRGSRVSVRAFVDTGNMLSDPLSGRSVIVIDKKTVRKIMSEKSIRGALDGDVTRLDVGDMTNMRLIPISTAAGGSMLCAFRPDKVTVTVSDGGGRKKTAELYALFAPSTLALPNDKRALGCNALISPDLIT